MHALKHRDHYICKEATNFMVRELLFRPSLSTWWVCTHFVLDTWIHLSQEATYNCAAKNHLAKGYNSDNFSELFNICIKEKSCMYMCSKRTTTYVRICRSNSLLVPKLTLNLSAITTIFSILYIPHLSPYAMFNVYVLSQQSESKGKFLLILRSHPCL